MLQKVKEHIGSFLPAFRSKNYRLYFIGQGISLVGSWMQMIAEQWLVYPILTTNKSLLGLIGAVGMLPMLVFVLFAGVLVDRVNKRNVFLFFQYVYMVIAIILFFLIATHQIQLWHIFLAALVSGTIMAFETPTRMTFVMDLVDKKDLPSALALNQAMFNTARAVGPALAGFTIAAIGIAPAYLANGLSFFAVIASIYMMRFPKMETQPVQHQPLLKGLKEGFQFIGDHKIYLALLGIVGIMTFFSWPIATLLPVFAHDIYKTGEVGFGLLQSAFGIGAVIAGLSFHTLYAKVPKKYLLIYIGMAVTITMFSIFAWSPWFWLALVTQVFGGWAISTIYTTANTLIITTIPQELRGRIMSIYMFVFMGGMPFGALLSSGLVTLYGPRMTVFICAIATFISGLTLILSMRKKLQSKIMTMV
jgi:MFS family permease